MFCPKCGKEIRDDAAFCSACGAKVGAPDPAPDPQPVAPAPAPQGFASAASSPSVVALKTVPPISVNLAEIAMFKETNTGIALQMDNAWGETVFSYMNPQDRSEDCRALFAAFQQFTGNMVLQFNSDERPVVPLYRIKKITANDWWKRLELEIEGAGLQWFLYSDKNTLFADYSTVTNLMQGGPQQLT
ncbi:MAG: zinc ribbon domain-containing protein [Actinomycetia bacterium]|nr:zinc ribbon domain-containing protein [Actinomycetes bacterium]